MDKLSVSPSNAQDKKNKSKVKMRLVRFMGGIAEKRIKTMDEKMRVLKMVEEGKISAEQAVNLLDALGEAAEEAEGQDALAGKDFAVSGARDGAYENKMLRVVVDSAEGDKVNVQLPVKIIRQVLKVTGKLPIQGKGVENFDLDALTVSILECLDSETLGNILDVNAADGSTVKIFIG